jgi:PAS domain S-box-containing protein
MKDEERRIILHPSAFILHHYVVPIPWLLTSVVLVALAVVIVIRQKGSRVARLFCLMITLVAIWFGGFAGMLATSNASTAFLFAKIGLAAVAVLPAAIYDFTATALRLTIRRGAIVATLWVVAIAFAVLMIDGRSMLTGVARYPWGFYPVAGPLLSAFLVFFFGVLFAQLGEYALEYRRTGDDERRARLRDLMISFIIVYTASIDFTPMFGLVHRPIGYVPVIAFVAFAWQTIRRHRLRPITAARAAREILDTMADALFVLDADGRIRVMNDAARKIFGYADIEILGRSIDILEPCDFEETISRTLRDMLRRGAVRDQERIFRDKRGDHIDVSISISPVHEEEIEEGAVVIVRDIRERKRAEEELRAFTRKLQQSNAELEDFAYVASHDLQEPLRKIQAFGDRLKSRYASALAPEAVDYLQRMQNAASRMQNLINDLLTFSRVTTKAQPFVSVDLSRVAAEVVHDLEPRIHDTEAKIIAGELPTIEADPLQMRQLVQNLLSNAIKFHQPGVPPQVRISGNVDHERVEIVVEDNGIGFDEKYADKIFTMFERLHGRGTYEGTGIGLAICRKIALRHSGDIVARSSPGEGATFIVTLPVAHPEKEIGTA